MHACTVIAYHVDGCVVCPDCIGGRADDEETGAVFADAIEEEQGATCDACGACLLSDGEWYPHDDAVGPTVRWSVCDCCDSQKPWLIGDSDYRAIRRAAMRNQARCPDCGQPALHFRAGRRN